MRSSILFSDTEFLRLENHSLKANLENEKLRNDQYEEEISRLHEMLRALKREKFGSRRERWLSQDQMPLFNEAEAEAKNEDLLAETVKVNPHSRKRGKRKPLPKDVPREVVVIDLPEADKVAPDGSALRVMGHEVSEKLVYEPATVKIIEYHRLKYGGAEGQDTVKVAPVLPCIVPKSIVTPSLLSQIITSKFADGLPLYRQEMIFARIGIEIPRSSMGRWIVTAHRGCVGIWNALEERLLRSPYASCDETPVQVLKEKGRTAESKSWMWVRSTPGAKNKIILFDYDPSRSGEVARRLFADYEGYLQVDGYAGYNGLETQKGLVRVGCNMHGRRKFHEALDGAAKGQSLAKEGLDLYGKLFEIEERGKLMSHDERFLLRQKEAIPVWDSMKLWAQKHQALVPPKSKIGTAFHYFLNQYEYLSTYLKDGMLEIDNGFAERAVKNFAIGRKNWLFCDTAVGAEASSLFYSFVVTAKLNGVDPYYALNEIFTQVPLAKTADDYDRLAAILLGIDIPDPSP